MKRIISSAILISMIFVFNVKGASEIKDQVYINTMKQDLLCLFLAYPDYISDIKKDEDNYVYMVMKSGKKIIYDDKKVKNIGEKLSNPDLQDMLEDIYPLTPITHIMDKNFDPGRRRVYELLKEVYGETRQKAEANLKNITYGIRFNGNNNASKAMETVMKELIPLSHGNSRASNNVFPLNGTFNYRLIAGTNQLSPHSFGIAIDLARDSRDYWKWASVEKCNERLEAYPKEIEAIFEKNNFIWGGKWAHFDIMHYEYRPEIIMKGRYFGNKMKTLKNWYDNIPMENKDIKNYIGKIDEVLE